ncbi:bifunctional diaminohydroxyphosphoribosylaminopyrimidine deaminase/5-amino-6-(5-phosphoribosylamino)uracil reductase RibD [Candidatus Chlorohelix allophototropha]|uniref:Riboflavin biosynthesis protein RibD n=2 Tax=Candidatus Chlorohelix allophototropha TaxID=3003348 RepID=A0ABY9B9K1_9CHLR|nr:bifunctional diaminohydroxyphosphoribosylaminopyrimidine deaminase/5-amino-6-(5-phosphoribosylamino)uracil reductase RibD [Chloroflexota bacterium L227-S17]
MMSDSFTEVDITHMKRALELGQMGRGRSSPNPAVGAVIVDEAGNRVGEGFTMPPGQAHAEVVALGMAGERARGGTLYVTLEPCASYGRTPPCTEAIIKAGIKRVFYAAADPNPKMQGGAEVLHNAGIDVYFGLLQEEAIEAHAPFFHWLKTRRPYVIAKYAMTLDGKIATVTGDSRWVSCEASRQEVYKLRDECDSIIVGAGTVLADDPLLTARLPASYMEGRLPHQPVPVVLDSRGRIPITAKVVRPGAILVTTAQINPELRKAFEAKGMETLLLEQDSSVRVDLLALLEELGRRGHLLSLLEGGGELMSSFFFSPPRPLINKVWAFIAPKVAGGLVAPGPMGGVGVNFMREALQFGKVAYRQSGVDLLVEAWLPEE